MKRNLKALAFVILLFVGWIFLTGRYTMSGEGEQLSKIGNELMLNGFSEYLINGDLVGSVVMSLQGQGLSTVYPLTGDLPGQLGSEATHRLIIQRPRGDIVIRLL